MKHPGVLNDILFRIVFGSQSSEPVLRALLNALLGLEGSDRIVELTLLNPILEKDFVGEKGPILDLKAKDVAGRQYNVEVQRHSGSDSYTKRSFYYGSRFYAEQLQQGASYKTLRKTVCLSILDFVLFPDSPPIHHRFELREREQHFLLDELLELHFVELTKFRPDKPQQLQTPFERWLYFLKFSDLYEEHELPDDLAREEGISMALDSMRRAYANDPIRERILAQEKADRDERSRMEAAMDEGLAKGLAEGKAEGLAEGKAEVARKMKGAGFDSKFIGEFTGLSQDDIDRL